MCFILRFLNAARESQPDKAKANQYDRGGLGNGSNCVGIHDRSEGEINPYIHQWFLHIQPGTTRCGGSSGERRAARVAIGTN